MSHSRNWSQGAPRKANCHCFWAVSSALNSGSPSLVEGDDDLSGSQLDAGVLMLLEQGLGRQGEELLNLRLLGGSLGALGVAWANAQQRRGTCSPDVFEQVAA